MSKIYVYSRNEQNLITYRGDEGWFSRDQAIDYYCQQGEAPVTERVMGWPHNAITWYGNIGFGEKD